MEGIVMLHQNPVIGGDILILLGMLYSILFVLCSINKKERTLINKDREGEKGKKEIILQ
jgi:hypothetical protein